MPPVTMTNDDLAPFADIESIKAAAMIADAMALAAQIAPCILEDDFAYGDAAKAIIRGAVLRWNEVGAGGYVQEQETTGPFSKGVTRTSPRRGMFWPAEITDLQKLCVSSGGAFAVDTAPGGGTLHADTCALIFGADYCSCGAVLAGFPLWGDP